MTSVGTRLDARAKREIAGWAALAAGIFALMAFALAASAPAPIWIAGLATGASAVLGAALGAFGTRSRWNAEGGLAAYREVDGWIRDRRLPTDLPLGGALTRLEKRSVNLRVGFPIAMVVINTTQAFFPHPDRDGWLLGLPIVHAGVALFFAGQLAHSLILRPRITALIREGQRRFASGEAGAAGSAGTAGSSGSAGSAGSTGAPPSGASSSAPTR
ncbi:hypothetical protein AS850_15665 [Frondihabitans sp. 762G35]|uniref:hypothetical protein n=1 Tax=Frondihabitans sp. 762G35 TaxID=1446794 RepID=UPI000D1FF436|nr:hypothetical protein [Frondihabitans sp. 762G35]ARC58525.1 hypothetical protein AS850_15665 [Frondihabitans sp. 762G35]